MHRRQFLLGAAGTLAAQVVVRETQAAARAKAEPVVTELADRLWLVSGCGGNVTVLRTPEGVLLVDAGAAAHTGALLKAVKRLTGTDRVHTLFNTHWHADQTGGNLVLGKAGTRIVAHENTRLWLTTDVELKWEGRTYQPLPKIAQPSQTFYTGGSLEFGGERIDYAHLPQAHTDGDLYVKFGRANVIVAGDVVAAGAFPIIDYCSNGWIGGLGGAVQALLGAGDDATRYVPGQGVPQGVAHLKAELEMLTTMRQRLSKLLANGMSAREMIDARPAADYEAAWGDASLFIANAWEGLVHRAMELGVSIV